MSEEREEIIGKYIRNDDGDIRRSLKRNYDIKKKYEELIRVNQERNRALKMMSVVQDYDLSEEEEEVLYYQIWSGSDLMLTALNDGIGVYDPELFEDVYKIWEASIDKEFVEALFSRLSGMNFEEILRQCEEKMCDETQESYIRETKELYEKVLEREERKGN